MSDPSQLSSTIAELLAKTAGLDVAGEGFDGTVGATTPSTGAFTYASQSVGAALTAVGTNRASALQLSHAINQVTGGDTGTGVILPDLSSTPGADVLIFNDNSSAIKVYATGSQTIDGTAGSSGVTLTNAKRCVYIPISDTEWLSAQLGVPSA